MRASGLRQVAVICCEMKGMSPALTTYFIRLLWAEAQEHTVGLLSLLELLPSLLLELLPSLLLESYHNNKMKNTLNNK